MPVAANLGVASIVFPLIIHSFEYFFSIFFGFEKSSRNFHRLRQLEFLLVFVPVKILVRFPSQLTAVCNFRLFYVIQALASHVRGKEENFFMIPDEV